jgi:hypothetical protein
VRVVGFILSIEEGRRQFKLRGHDKSLAAAPRPPNSAPYFLKPKRVFMMQVDE